MTNNNKFLINTIMNSHSLNLVNFKNPNDIFSYCEKHNITNKIDDNSEIWNNLIEKNYKNHFMFKKDALSYKDYYVLLYFIQSLNLINDTFIISKGQEILSLLSKTTDVGWLKYPVPEP